METLLQQHQSPMAQFNYDATYEHHETHYETSETIETSETLTDWYHRQLTLAEENPLKTHLLHQCYYKVLAYKIEYSGMHQDRTDYQHILLFQHLLNAFSRIYR